MAGKYAATSARAHGLIARKGGKGVVTRTTATFDPVAQTETSTNASANFVAVAAKIDLDFASKVFGDLVGRKITRIWISNYNLAINPEPGDGIRWAGDSNWVVKWTGPVDPAGDGVVVTDVYMES